MASENPRGKYKYSEPPVTRHFDFPKKLDDELRRASKEHNRAAVAIVQDALQSYFARGANPTTPAIGIEDIKRAVAEVVQSQATGQAPDVICVQISDEATRQSIEQRAAAMQYESAASFMQALARAATTQPPRELQALLDETTGYTLVAVPSNVAAGLRKFGQGQAVEPRGKSGTTDTTGNGTTG